MHIYISSFRLGMMALKETRQHAALCIILNEQELEQALMKVFR